jgi:hypothetical protein
MNSLIKNEIEEETIETEAHFQPSMAYVKEDVELLRSGVSEDIIYLSYTVWKETFYSTAPSFI